MSNCRLIYTTWPDMETAESAARSAVESGLAACANILPGMVSVFRWDGAMQRAGEVVMLLKTTAAAAPALSSLMSSLHPYETPAVMSLVVDPAASSLAFLSWIASECAAP